ncbi:1188_t:CDS:10 [Ambispora gerdemannii]|uniref:1188_t:CDS:1 n=1 Tax=Ambispora gerdemannii TaxID=144530 RepID=A0A9N8UXP4_9GLOM|nr:1188_t:CDS:10 [Ambispora gerdemannii]
MKIAIEGCCHSQLETIYRTLEHIQQVEKIKIDLLLICGDVQTVRNWADLDSVAVPIKHRYLGTFYKYYSGECKAPIPTLVIGGNHEASNYLWELYHGGWVCENIYFLGYAGVVNFGGLRIGGISGIYKMKHYDLGHFETLPYSDSSLRSIYHIRNYEVTKLEQLRKQLDIFMSHEWPRGIERYGDTRRLIANKPFFQGEATNNLGNPACEQLLYKLKPRYWFAAHLHVKFSAVLNHDSPRIPITSKTSTTSPTSISTTVATSNITKTTEVTREQVVPVVSVVDPDEIQINMTDSEDNDNEMDNNEDDGKPTSTAIATAESSTAAIEDNNNPEVNTEEDVISLSTTPTHFDDAVMLTAEDDDDEVMIGSSTMDASTPPVDFSISSPSSSADRITRFLALDKCMPFRDFLQILDFPEANGPLEFTYDEEWLAITKAMHPYLSIAQHQTKIPSDTELQRQIEVQKTWVRENVTSRVNGLTIPHNFKHTSPPIVEDDNNLKWNSLDPRQPFLNPQTVTFNELLGIENKINPKGQIIK